MPTHVNDIVTLPECLVLNLKSLLLATTKILKSLSIGYRVYGGLPFDYFLLIKGVVSLRNVRLVEGRWGFGCFVLK